jgi:hypothetical protein
LDYSRYMSDFNVHIDDQHGRVEKIVKDRLQDIIPGRHKENANGISTRTYLTTIVPCSTDAHLNEIRQGIN